MAYITVQLVFKNTGGHAIEISSKDFAEEYTWFENAYLKGNLLDFSVDGVSYKDTLEHLPEPAIIW